MDRVYVGVDLGSSVFNKSTFNAAGAVIVNRFLSTSEMNLRRACADLEGEVHLHLEAGDLAHWAAAIIQPLVARLVCSHPPDDVWIAKASN